MLILTNNVSILKEAYFGSSKYLKEAEEHIARLIEIAKKSNSKFKLSECPANKKLESALAKQFGVESVNIHWMRSPSANAYTRPYMTQFSGISEYINKKNYNSTKVFRNSSKKIFLSSTDTILTGVGFTPEEILAVILHEIGHNFDTTTLRMFQGIPFFWASTIISNLGHITDMVTDSIIRQFSILLDPVMDLFHLFTKEMGFFSPITRIINFIKNLPSLKSLKMIEYVPDYFQIATNIINFGAAYGSERFADSFATSYGYGPQLSNALMKLDSFYKENTFIGEIVNEIPVVNCVYSFAVVFDDIITSMKSVHPQTGTRIKISLNKLKRDLADPSIDAGMKKAIGKDIDALEKLYDDYLEVRDIPEYRTCVLVGYRKMNEKIFGGKLNIHEILNMVYEKEEV